MTTNQAQAPAAGGSWSPEALARLSAAFEACTPQEVLRWALSEFAPDIALACSFGAEDVALVDMVWRIRPETSIFYLDTEVLFPETYATRDRLAERYGIRFLQIRPAVTLEGQELRFGPDLWARDPDRCCHIRKVQPLRSALAGLRAWITGIRREQSPTRKTAPIVEADRRFGLVKVNPLARWTWADVWAYILAHDVPSNPLHGQGYPSIGCIHCTAPVAPGEDPRAGRWKGKGKLECGLHG